MLKRLRQLWSAETNGLTAAAVIVGIASLASRGVGIIRDRILASSFGAGHDLDAYYAAFRVPDTLYNLIILGALSAGFIPVFAEYMETKTKAEAWRLAEQVLSVVAATMTVVCALLALFTPFIVPLTVPGFSSEQLELTIQLSRILFLSPLLLGLSAVLGGILQATRRIFAFALAPVVYNLGIIFGALVLAPRFGIQGVAWGVILGSLFHFAVQLGVVMKLGLRGLPWPSLKHSGVRRILALMAPRTAGLAVSQLNLVIILGIASTLTVGSVAVMNLAINLQSFPVGIFGISYAVAAFPLLARAASTQNMDEFGKTLRSSARKIIFLILPVTALFFLLRAQIVRLVLGAGVFNWDDTIRTAGVLGFFAISLVGQALIPLYARAFYALQNTRTPLWISIVSEALNVGVAIAASKMYGLTGLAIAFSVATYVNVILLRVQLWRVHHIPFSRTSLRSFMITVAACIGFMAVGYPIRQVVGTMFPLHTYAQVALQAGAAALGGGCAFFFVAWLLRSPELAELLASMTKKMFASKQPISGAGEAQGV